MEKDELIEFCPRCRSTDIGTFHPLRRRYLPSMPQCNNCGYRARTFPRGDPQDIPDILEPEEWKDQTIIPQKPTWGKIVLLILAILIAGYAYMLTSGRQQSIAFTIILLLLLWLVLLLSGASRGVVRRGRQAPKRQKKQ